MKTIMPSTRAPWVYAAFFAFLSAGGLSASPSQVDKTPDFAPIILDNRIEREDYNLRFGPVFVDIIGTSGIEYYDNINTSEVDPIADWILQPGVSFGLKWQMNESTEIDLNLGLEYWHYLSESDLNEFDNQLGLTPNTELSFRVLVGDVVFRVYDRLQYSFDSADSVVVDPNTGDVIDSDPEAFTRFRNILGLQTEWFIRETIFSAQLSREDIYSPEDIFSYVNRHEHKAALNVEHPLAANFLIGAGTSYAVVDFDEDVNNDGTIFTFGPYFEWKITEVIGLYAGVAYNDWDYDKGALTDTLGDKSDFQDATWMVRLSHVANEVFNHQIEWYRAATVSNTSNFNLTDGIRYTLAYNLTPRIRLDGAVGYEEVESSGGLLQDNDFDRWIAGVSTELVLGQKMEQFIADARERYDFVIFDTAPILATDDTTSFARQMDAVLFTIRCAHTQIRQVKPALAHLRERHIEISGLVLNYVDTSQPGYYYRYSEYYTDPKRNAERNEAAASSA